MVNKRLRKYDQAANEVIGPELVGPEDYKNLVVCWGSTYHIVAEALRNLGRDDLAMLHYKQVYPLPQETARYLKKAQKTIIVENNATAQLARLIKLRTGIEIEYKILKYNGLSFFVEELIEKLNEVL